MIMDIVLRVYRKLTQNPRIHTALQPLVNLVTMQKGVAGLAAKHYERSRDLLEMDITYYCNLRCCNCNRSCGLAPTDDRLSLEQIIKFLQESREKGVKWQRFRILGGEPTLHPEFFWIIDELLAYKQLHNPELHIHVVTNGSGKKVKAT
jgi:molybdenum cofactor biosynthesis enzyme MoaA